MSGNVIVFVSDIGREKNWRFSDRRIQLSLVSSVCPYVCSMRMCVFVIFVCVSVIFLYEKYRKRN